MFKQVKFIYFLLFLIGFSCANSKKSIDNNNIKNDGLDIFLLIGQSNMQGVAPVEDLDTISLKNVYLFTDKNDWELAKNFPESGINRYSTVKKRPKTEFGPAYTFGRKIAKYTNRNIGIVSNARGATRVLWWQKGYNGERGDYNLFEEAVKRTKVALASNPNSKLKGILWHQGEADNKKERSELYIVRLKALVKDLRTEFNNPNLPFIAGEVGKWNNRGENVNPKIRSIKENISNTDWVNSDGLSTINLAKNDPHFDNLSQRVFGGRYADKTAALVYDIIPKGVTLFSSSNFKGRSVLLSYGNYSAENLESDGILIGEIASAKIDDNYELIFNLKNDKRVYKNDIENIENKNFESIKIVKK